ncbi:MAG: sigma-54-dependent Fis family transcriptional regulator [Elusimicrobia bacterium]|nr:sigma-54-dependent Fis family transcriptional regulator [Elusimicrobiota bacterium]
MKANLLIVDDEPDAGRLLAQVLREQGFAVRWTASGEAALKQIKQAPPDLVLLDVVLPKMDGVETLRRIKALTPRVAVIMITGQETVKTAVQAMKLGACDYLPKPLVPNQLGGVIRQALQVQAMEQRTLKIAPRREPVKPEEMVGQDLSLVAIFDLVRRIAPQDVTVLIRGESGTGKELIAQSLHSLSPRRPNRFVTIDCASLPEALFESELFGYERGAFTGAETVKEGWFEQANGGTLFLDEIGNLSPTAQAKLLRVVQDRAIRRLGSQHPIQLDVRLLAATNQNLEDLMTRGLFREDLFHRLNVCMIHLPPLRQRDGDIRLLTHFFLERFNRAFGKTVQSISEPAMELLNRYPWPGNVRELENTMKAAILLSETEIAPEHLPERIRRVDGAGEGLAVQAAGGLREVSRRAAEEVEKQLVLRTLRETRGNKKAAAARLGIDYKTLFNKLKAFQVTNEMIETFKGGKVNGS